MNPIYRNSEVTPRILLNFDLNGTLILKDTSKKVDDDYMLISALAESTISEWDEKQSMSFKQYVYTVLLPGDKSRPELKAKRQQVVGKFVEWLEDHKHPALESVKLTCRKIKEKFTDPKTGKMNFPIFPSFYVMMDKLREKKIPFTIILRTFGSDLPEVMKEIEEHPSGVKFSHTAKFEGPKLTIDGKRTIEKTAEIFDVLLNSEEHFAIQDDWIYWNRNKEQGLYGKPFQYDFYGTSAKVENLSLFFDDNITGDQILDIVNPCEISGLKIPTKELCERFIFPVNTLEAMLDDNYFINRVMKAIKTEEFNRLKQVS
jgi:hypothetical protein